MKKANELNVKGTAVRVVKIDGQDFVCLTDMAKLKSEDPSFTINHWMRNRMTIEYLGLWESLYNPNFKPTEFGRFRSEAGLNSFTLSPSKWIESVNAIGIVVQIGRYGGTYAQKDIAFEFGSAISVLFKLYPDEGAFVRPRQSESVEMTKVVRPKMSVRNCRGVSGTSRQAGMNAARQRLRRFGRATGVRRRSAAAYSITATLSVVPDPFRLENFDF